MDSNSTSQYFIVSIFLILPNLMDEKWFYGLNVCVLPPNFICENSTPQYDGIK